MKSTLYLTGAGPGDPELITVKAIRVLKKADVILYDALVNDELLTYASSSALKIFVGKRYGCHALSQQEINQLIIEYGSKHKNIVRLKGGDPFVFGRAQEEIDAARNAGMLVEIVPGISSALAVPASCMIPLSCRGVNESFWVATGTTKSGEISSDIHLAAQSSATIVLLMAMSKLDKIVDIFIAAGKRNTPVAIIQDGTTSRQRIITGTINDIALKASYAGITNPAIIIVGEVVNINAVSEVVRMHPEYISQTA